MVAPTLYPTPSEKASTPPQRPRRLRKCCRWLGLTGLLLGLGLLWLNGPGMRWLGPLVARHFLGKYGLTCELRIEGSLTGGVSIADLRLHGAGTLAGLTVDRITPHYRCSHLVKGKIDGLSLEGAHADLRLGLDDEKPMPDAKKPPLDLEQLVQTLRSIRTQVIPLQIDLKRLSLNATREGKPVFILAPSRLFHVAGDDAFTLEIGELTDLTGREWPAQTTRLGWTVDALSIDHLDPLPGIGVRDLTLRLPGTGGPSLVMLIHLGDGVMRLESSPGFASAKLSLISGTVDIANTLKPFALNIPVAATLSALTLDAEHLMPAPGATTCRAQLTLTSLAWQDWQIPRVSIDTALETQRATLAVRANAFNSPFSLDAEIALARTTDQFLAGDARGAFHITNAPEVIRDLAARIHTLRPHATVPESSLDGSFLLAIQNNTLLAADLNTTLTPADPSLATPIALHARWHPDQPALATLTLDGAKITAHYDSNTSAYDGILALDGFSSSRTERWLAIAGVSADGSASVTASWSGSGKLSDNIHSGELKLTRAAWQQADAPPITATGGIRYHWPETLTVHALNVVRREKQGASCQVNDLMFQNLASRNYRVLQLC